MKRLVAALAASCIVFPFGMAPGQAAAPEKPTPTISCILTLIGENTSWQISATNVPKGTYKAVVAVSGMQAWNSTELFKIDEWSKAGGGAPTAVTRVDYLSKSGHSKATDLTGTTCVYSS